MDLTKKLEKAISEGQTAAGMARTTRAGLRRSSTVGSEQREQRIGRALREINFAMEPIRSLIAKSLWDVFPAALEEKLRATSKALQYEKKQLKKMQRPR